MCYFHEKLDHRNNMDCEIMREWIKCEYNGALVTNNGKSHRVGLSTKGKLGYEDGLIDKIIDDMEEQNGLILRNFVLNPTEYKNWRDTIFPDGSKDDPDNWIDYCKLIKKI